MKDRENNITSYSNLKRRKEEYFAKLDSIELGREIFILNLD